MRFLEGKFDEIYEIWKRDGNEELDEGWNRMRMKGEIKKPIYGIGWAWIVYLFNA